VRVNALLTRLRWLACLIAVLGSGCPESETSIGALQASESTEPELPNVPIRRAGLPKVAFLGDGIAAGRYIVEQQAFPYVLQRQLRARGADFTLLNASVSGDTTEDALRRIDWILKQEPKVVVIELGASDNEQALPAATVEANLRAIISKVRAAQAKPLLLGLSIAPAAHAERASALAYARSLESIYPRIAEDMNVPFVSHFMQGVAGRRELTLPDGVHPTPEGHERVASNIQESLRRLLAE
jgi:acyl-CoA thioesterase-1